MIRLENITKVYRSSEVETTALNNINLNIEAGEFISIMGPSGCGKSTLLNVLGMLDSPSDGKYFFNGEQISRYSERKLAQKRKGHIGFIFQSFNLIDELSVAENIAMPLFYQGIARAERQQRVDEVMQRLNIAHRAKHMPQQLSGGQQQRVAVARALICKPEVILADEPTGNLDSKHGDEVMELLKQVNDEGTTILMVTHSQYHAEYAKRLIHLFDGKVVSENQLAKVAEHA
ncbi:ABC transporter ATP-binding protein [Agaribacterium haliotis]|uniref:ABC transporter ATP-binding protein n=1 Tax=Agaribacterium haliotis TaxID=2013869 RepID=UPI000BB55CC9|nr:ABC transporter ATP-binding protein [Agaribacterium haliotis]